MFSVVLSLILFAGTAGASERPGRLEELMLWKMSDELRLAPAEEKAFSEVVRDLNRKKAELSRKLESELSMLKLAKTAKERSASLTRYRKTLNETQGLSLEEFDRLKKLFGDEKLARYLDVKKDLADKVKALLLEKTESAPLPPPKVIEAPAK